MTGSRGVAGSAPRPLSPTELKRLHRRWRSTTGARLALLLDAVQSPFNVGAIVRTAAALRVEHLWLVGPTASPTDPKAGRTALGTQRFVTWSACEDPAKAAAEVHAAGYRLVGVELAGGALPLHGLDLGGDVCLAVGHEDRGLSASCLAECDAVGFIPLLGRVGSLNVASATAIALYEARRQHWDAAPGAGPAP